MTPTRLVAGALLTVTLLPGHAATDGKTRAQTACAVCHGPQGLSSQPNVPNLAGQPKPYLMEQLRHYRSGRRQHEVMSVVAKPLTDQDIEVLSDWYSSLLLSVQER